MTLPLISVAPMMDWTDRHCRYFHRLLTKETLLYTEMITTGALLFGDTARFLHFDPAEQPLALQLGGSDPEALAKCAQLAEQWGYQEVNLNAGCPSDRVQSGKFGLCLMKEPQLTADCLAAMKAACNIRVSIKTRTGVDEHDHYDQLTHFVDCIQQAGIQHIIIHARKGWLKGLSPKENRTIPPLQYETVYQLKKDFPHLWIGINGGIETLDAAEQHLQQVDHVMMGRAAYHNPYCLAEVDQRFHQATKPPISRPEVIQALIPYIQKQLANDVYLKHITRHILGLFHGQPGGKKWRRALSENAHQKGADEQVVLQALKMQEML